MIVENPTAFTKLTPTFNDSNFSSLFPEAEIVIIIPTIHTTEVLVTFNKDLVRASNNFVIFNPFKL